MALTRTRTQELFQRAKKSFPYGVNSNFRYWGEEETNVFVRGEKCYVLMPTRTATSITAWASGR